MLLFVLLAACRPDSLTLGSFDLALDEEGGTLGVDRKGIRILDLTGLAVGAGSADIDFQVGSYLFSDVQAAWRAGASYEVREAEHEVVLLAELRDDGGDALATLEVWTPGEDLLAVRMAPFQGTTVEGAAVNRVQAALSCEGGGPMLGAGGHQLDVDHQGEAFSLWVSEPGIGKVETDDPPEDWFITGTRHATSYPAPFVLRPELPVGVGLDTGGRVDLDLCASDPDTWSMAAWDEELLLYVVAGDDALDVVETNARATGGVVLPPDWAFGPWNDAVRGVDRVLGLAAALRAAGAPTALIWTEDWKGAEETALGYHLSNEWYVDEALYPDPAGIAAELRAQGFAWLAYLSPFVGQETRAWEETAEAGLLMHTAEGEVYTFTSPILESISALDLTDGEARAWAQGRMQELLDLGFAGWMADYAEWLPPDAVLDGADPVMDHNLQPLWWQATNAELLLDADAAWFTRSGWTGTPALSPITWGGDQRTSFMADDGYPTVLPLGLGLGISGVPVFTHDVAGYSSANGNGGSTRELWQRWAWLGAFSPILRSHHGAVDEDNIQVDTDAETLAHWARVATEHSRLYPYRRGLAALAAERGRPMLLHPALVYGGYDWARMDAWLLGEALLVAPVLEEGATGRQVDLPAGDWYDWWTGARVQGGWFEADAASIPVFAAGGSVVPLLAEAPQTFLPDADPALVDLAEADAARVIRVFGAGGRFTEADGTTYAVSGTAGAAGTATAQLQSGTVEVEGLTVTITGSALRSYTVEVWP